MANVKISDLTAATSLTGTDQFEINNAGTSKSISATKISEFVASSSAPLTVDKGGTGQTSYTNGQLLIGNTTGNTLAKATLTAGNGINITNGAGSITISASGGSTGSTMYLAANFGAF